MRAVFCCLCLLFSTVMLEAQTRSVDPNDLELWVEVEETRHPPFAREMILITVRGIYRRHITLEKLAQPDFEGFSWTQLGNDLWRDERLNGEAVKTFRRRMAIYPDQAGTLTVGSFVHNLTLTDESDKWFEHQVRSEPFTVEVAPPPLDMEWWFPVKGVTVSDEWSNAPDQLAQGEGVLRVVRVEALGATPEMIPPMPELTSPSAMIFPHPEKRFTELSPQGPMTFAFWRWTIRPSNDTSTIVEPISFEYYDTVSRVPRTVTISAQRIAYGTVVPAGVQTPAAGQGARPEEASLPGWPFLIFAACVAMIGAGAASFGREFAGLEALRRTEPFDALARQMRRAARRDDAVALRRVAAALLHRDGPSETRAALLRDLDQTLFDPNATPGSLSAFARAYLAAR